MEQRFIIWYILKDLYFVRILVILAFFIWFFMQPVLLCYSFVDP